MGDVVGATNTKIAPAAERVIPETYSLINDTFNISGSNRQFKLGVDTYAGVCAVLTVQAVGEFLHFPLHVHIQGECCFPSVFVL